MGRCERVVLFQNAVETLGYFSRQIEEELKKQGIETYVIDYDNLYETVDGLSHFLKRGNAALLTFNFIGLRGEDIFFCEDGKTIWEKEKMRILNILVDHPMYFHAVLEKTFPNMQVFCVDREHVSYLSRFYPQIKAAFLPLAGNVASAGECAFLPFAGNVAIEGERVVRPMKKRTQDVVFTGNYVPTSVFEKRLNAQGEEYRKFYQGIIDDLLTHPVKSVDAVLEEHIIAEVGSVSKQELRATLGNLVFLDQWVRSEMRSKVITALLEADVKVLLVGADWELFPCKKPQNIRRSAGMVSSATCVEATGNAKISLNVLPWFRDGAHDRVFTAMQSGAVAVTDESRYLTEQFTDGEDIIFYSLEQIPQLPERIHKLLDSPDTLEQIAAKAFQKASTKHTWSERAKVLLQYL